MKNINKSTIEVNATIHNICDTIKRLNEANPGFAGLPMEEQLKNPEFYAVSIRSYDLFFRAAYEWADNHIGEIAEDKIVAFMDQYEARTGYTADKESTIAGIIDVVAADWLAKKTDEPNVTKWQHDLWSWHRLQEGWKYGERKDKANKINPCLKDFSLLTEEEISWDMMFYDLYRQTIKR